MAVTVDEASPHGHSGGCFSCRNELQTKEGRRAPEPHVFSHYSVMIVSHEMEKYETIPKSTSVVHRREMTMTHSFLQR